MAIDADPPRTCSSTAWPTPADSTLHPPMTLNSSATSTIHRLSLIRTDLNRQILRYPTLDSLTPGTRWDFELKVFFSDATFILRRGVELEQDPVKFNEHKGKWDTNIRSKINSVRTTMVKFAPWFQRVHRTLTRLFRVDGRVALGTAMELSEDELLAVFRNLTDVMDRVDVAVNGRSTAPREARVDWQSGRANGRENGREVVPENGGSTILPQRRNLGENRGRRAELDTTGATPEQLQALERWRALENEMSPEVRQIGPDLDAFMDELGVPPVGPDEVDVWEDVWE
ncbi:hypothetical protein KVT40_002110 [Elsinoe batatas]|uniref:Uncharacterized protein n=1 Tax=Elsinoe batatas TaxID=2601811 RepID=A0A8K0L5V9_9PEZI|nr:hypothetical protein KVT40_002110 [Elsinoe batatas]